jgi:hypothetical protein
MKKITIITLIIGSISLLFYFLNGKIFDSYHDKLKVKNNTNDTLCYWFLPISSNLELFNIMHSKSFYPEFIYPNKISSYGVATDWESVIERMGGRSLNLLNYKTIKAYQNNELTLDSNVITNVVRLNYILNINKLDSTDWIITINPK